VAVQVTGRKFGIPPLLFCKGKLEFSSSYSTGFLRSSISSNDCTEVNNPARPAAGFKKLDALTMAP